MALRQKPRRSMPKAHPTAEILIGPFCGICLLMYPTAHCGHPKKTSHDDRLPASGQINIGNQKNPSIGLKFTPDRFLGAIHGDSDRLGSS